MFVKSVSQSLRTLSNRQEDSIIEQNKEKYNSLGQFWPRNSVKPPPSQYKMTGIHQVLFCIVKPFSSLENTFSQKNTTSFFKTFLFNRHKPNFDANIWSQVSKNKPPPLRTSFSKLTFDNLTERLWLCVARCSSRKHQCRNNYWNIFFQNLLYGVKKGSCQIIREAKKRLYTFSLFKIFLYFRWCD